MIDASHYTVLLIEDSPEDRATIGRFLAHEPARPYELIEAADATSGLRLWQERQPDCVLLDILLPDLSGLDLLATIRRAAGEQPVPVIMLTGLDDISSAVKSLTSGAQGYLLKDRLVPAELWRTIESTVEKVRLQHAHQQSIDALRASEKRLRLFEMIATHIHDALLITEAEPIDQPGPRIVYVNPAFTEMTGYSAEDVIGATPRILQGPKTVRGELDRIRVALQRWEPVRVELVNYRKDGSEFDVEFEIVPVADATGWSTYWVSVQRDVTSRKRAEQERELLLAQEQAARAAAEGAMARLVRLQAITEALSQAQTTQHVADVLLNHELPALNYHAGVIALVSEDARNLEVLAKMGYAKEVAAPWSTIPLDMHMPLPDAVRTGEPIWLANRAEAMALYPALGHIWPTSEAWAIVPLSVDQHVLGGWGISFNTPQLFGPDDRNFILTVARQCAQALKRAQLYETAQRARALAEAAVRTRDQFLAVAAHELRNPLTTLTVSTQLLHRRAVQGSSITERDLHVLRTIADQSKRMNTLIKTLLDVSQLEIGQLHVARAPLDLAALAAQVCDDLRPTLTHHTLTYTAHAQLPILGDTLRLEQVIQNLLSNAIKYSPAGGEIRMSATQRDGYACLVIADQGIGIPTDAIPRLFQRFYRVDGSSSDQISGSGIGLYVVRELVELHGGEVGVESTEGLGSTFTVRLPLAVVASDRGAENQIGTS